MSETVAALLTPPGKSALAVIGLRGVRTWQMVNQFFVPRSGQIVHEAGRWWLGQIGDEIRDEGILAVQAVDPPCVEFQIHGGTEVVRHLLDLLASRGVNVLDWEAFLRAGEDADRAEVMVAMARALTSRTARILLDQLSGAFQRELQRGGDGLSSLKRRIPIGRRLTTPFRVVIAGAPNVGKSSLVNALAGYQRAIVSPIPGTTRDVVSTTLALDGWPVELLDTAGQRSTSERLEQAGIAEARQAMTEADLVLWVVEASQPFHRDNPAGSRVIVNKIDLPAVWDVSLVGDAPRVSATTGEGLDRLCAEIGRWLVPDPPPPGAGVPITARQIEQVHTLSALCRKR